MLSPESAKIVQATLPAVGQALDEITTRFYGTMFADNPDLLRNLFNRSNQANGEQRQALAGSIAAFASMLINRPDERPDALLSRIAHKHASLGVTPDQYTIVHKYLLAAVADVLGDAVTPEVAAAWDEVYWLMAGALIAMEARLMPDEDDPWLRATVVERRSETPDTISLILKPPAPLPFAPGQYISVGVELPDGARQIRQYSLSSAPGRGDWRITVKRVRGAGPDGEVSGWLHANVKAGDELTVSRPYGDLALAEGDTPLLLASAGIGGTPMLSMLDHLVATGSTRQVIVVHADRSPADHAHRKELVNLVDALPGATLYRWYEEAGDCSCDPAPLLGHADLSGIELPPGLVAYLCGPLPFMRGVRTELLRRGVPARAVHYEVFGPDLWLGQD
ncbi:nitric oxide dioxygenase [Streptosporangium becharense]|uniref:nitric oxide dioxygenase n=1 Tax=Streptosporangium becharense TaxID=1816182 RepID=A0A7W9II16_9ACTN|nr:globin domain-containing protein [Streptosporangium becharense]MBB2912499.1 nitric oxide dioxygenase [Streptosporangium becharense]MBB5820671.1 nitric oxide dioxygenase [Streptosporangium becharense]